MSSVALARALIVEDNAPLRAAIATMVGQVTGEVISVGTAREAIERLRESPDLIVADVCLPDGSALRIFEAARELVPHSLTIGISGVASAEQAFELAQLGVRAYLAKPFSLRDLADAIERVRYEAPPLDQMVRASVGRVSLRKVTTHVRNVMINEALFRTQGSRSGAARLLDVSRQAVQQVTRQMRKAARFPTEDQSAEVDTQPPRASD